MKPSVARALQRECPQTRRPRLSRSGLAAAGSLGAILIAGFLVGPRTMQCFCSEKIDIAKGTLEKYAHEAYPQWLTDHPSQSCPPDLDALNAYMNGSSKDPWGRHYELTCDASAAPRDRLRILSFGPDSVRGTDDDLRSWDGAE